MKGNIKARIAVWAWRTGIAGLIGLVLADVFAWQILNAEIPANIHRDLILLALVLGFGGGLARIHSSAIAPVREAFLHGYELRGEHERDLRVRAESEAAKVIHLPAQVYASAVGHDTGEHPIVPIRQHRRGSARRPRPGYRR